MDHFAVDKALSTMTVLCDTREQNTLRARKRFKQIGSRLRGQLSLSGTTP